MVASRSRLSLLTHILRRLIPCHRWGFLQTTRVVENHFAANGVVPDAGVGQNAAATVLNVRRTPKVSEWFEPLACKLEFTLRQPAPSPQTVASKCGTLPGS